MEPRMFALTIFVLFLVAVGILYFTTKKAVTPEQAVVSVEAKAAEAEADAKALVDNAEATVVKDLPKV